MSLTGVFERIVNRVTESHEPVPAEARRLFETLDVADLHADSLLWGRDLLERSSFGHADIPRLLEGRSALQVFGIVTKVPFPPRLKNNNPGADSIGLLARIAGWPREARASLCERALHQARRLREMADRSGGKLRLVGASAELAAFLDRRKRGEKAVAGFLGVEGAQALDDKLDNLDRLFDAGIRMMAPTHFQDNAFGGSAHGLTRGGLTELGRRWVAEMEKRAMIVDLAHASAAVIDDVLSVAKRPVVVSHTGVRGTCDNQRNLTDEQIKKIADGGGLIGIAYFKWAVCGANETSVSDAIRYAIDAAGEDHVALGSDFDGAVSVPFDAAHTDRIVASLLEAGVSEARIRKVMGGNVLRFMLDHLPGGRG